MSAQPESRPAPPAPRAAAVIRVLPPATVNRIAAGEVIERPAAAVKELVENALDAGATRIGIELDRGGIDRIAVTDDGSGMDAASLALAIERHATSKLAADDDLMGIATLGFRGEALPSIGAAARLAIVSRPHPAPGGPADSAHAISVEGGRVGPLLPAAGPPGTQVTVRDLFHATPARRKFLKSPRIEAEHAEAVVRRLAYAAPSVALRLVSDGRVVFDLPAQDRATRTASLLGAETAACLVPVEAAREGLMLTGYAALPAASRASAAHQSLIVNGRPVADPLLRTAVRVAYRDVLPAGRHPVVALWLTVPAAELDVNVHPAKTELRFADPAAIRALLIGALQRALAVGAGAALPSHPRWSGARPEPWPRPDRRPPLSLVPPARPPAGLAEAQLPFEAPPATRVLEPAPDASPAAYPLGAAVAQVLDTYVLALAADGALVLVDQHAAHERLTHEALRTQLLDGGVRSQPLLLPAVVDLPAADAARLLGHAEALARLGIAIEPFGPGAVLVRALPALLGTPDPAPLLRDLADELAEAGELAAPAETTSLQARLDAAIARLACHGSIRAGRPLARAEMDALLRRMEATPRAATCSHGRPTYLRLSRAEIEALFGRR
jgi:DNA mismatch repair protein MutL